MNSRKIQVPEFLAELEREYWTEIAGQRVKVKRFEMPRVVMSNKKLSNDEWNHTPFYTQKDQDNFTAKTGRLRQLELPKK